MKHRIIFIGTAVLVLLLSVVLYINYDNQDSHRYEQHLEAPGAREEEQKTVEDKEKFVTHLPIVKIETGGNEIPGEIVSEKGAAQIEYGLTEAGEKMSSASISLLESGNGDNSFQDVPEFESDIKIRYRGNSSRSFDKKNYLIKLVDKEGNEKKHKVLGMSSHNEWALHGPFLDKTLMRNYMWMNISADIMGYAPNVRFCEVFVDGEYRGLYLMMETVSRGEDRVNITKYEDGDRANSYIIRIDKNDGSEKHIEDFMDYVYIMEYKSAVGIVYPGSQRITPEIKKYIENDLGEFEKSLFSYDFQSSGKGYENYINVESFVDYYILQEFLLNNDMCSRSTYLYKDIKEKLTMGPVWDFNNVLNNFFSDMGGDGSGIQYADRLWYKMLFKDEQFVDRVVVRYRQLRESYLSEEYLYQYIDDTREYLGEAVDRNFSVWGYTFEPENLDRMQKLRPEERNPGSYDEAVSQMKEFIHLRGQWLDKNIDTLYQYCHESKNKNDLLK